MDAAKKEMRGRAVQVFSRWMYDAGIPFNAVNYDSFPIMVEALGQFGHGMKPPSYHEARVTYLRKEVGHTHELLRRHQEDCVRYNCSLMTDGWTSRNGKSLINFLVNCPRGSAFIESIDASSFSKNTVKMFELFCKYIEIIRPHNVIQVVTDNASENALAVSDQYLVMIKCYDSSHIAYQSADSSRVETQDGGDAKVEVSPRDVVYTQPAEFKNGEEPEILHTLDLRYGGISWCDDSLALVYESWYKTRRTKTWVISPGRKGASPRILFDRSSEDVYSDPGSPMMRRTQEGTYVIAKIKNQDEGTYILLNGSGATPDGNIPFLDLFDIHTGNKERIWESDKEKYYETVVALMSDYGEDELNIEQLKILTSKESKTENTQYFIQSWPDKKAVQITKFPHPYPQLAQLQKEMVRYQRKDGVQLTATLYLPPGYSPSDGPLPCLVWSYPGEFKSKDAAGQVRGSPNEFAGIGSTSALLWLARGFAILSGPTIPIIGEGDEEANDRYVEQLVSSAEAAVEEVIRRGVAHPNKIAVGGHSYGAFMTANLLAHAPHLFCCGIARSGAYNRTLTPYGFQNEDRTLWEAINTYVEMSPFMSANKIKKPLLLIHGEEDNNSGTLTMQSDRFFNALKGHGTLCRLVILPFESHGYSARESIMHVLWETDRWLQKYCIDAPDKLAELHDSKTEAPKTPQPTGGLTATEAQEDDGSNHTMRSLL
ncbi:probable glutamyl endopeptidase, chloroplastic [Dendrobium catenatum]|uniref:probable glutamyl endopeptidase, chloroplastic n=1 Tax=Dendrobium catenatum TaxID=906689 RepID=UPI0009F226A7|nr:probable glutamyl endopeptidase, chloroplastic [Dendrobium catenatum]